jgi:hypothetical protein
MSNTSITYLVAACAGVFSLAAFGVWILAPAWSSYSRAWERVAAIFLSFYVLAAFVGGGIGVGAIIVYYWDRLFP